jgi:hypothetical protein
MTATDAHWIVLAILVLGAAAWACWRIRWRRDDRAANLAAGIADERRMALMVADPTPYEDETVDLTEAVATLRERLIPVQSDAWRCGRTWGVEHDDISKPHWCLEPAGDGHHIAHRCRCGATLSVLSTAGGSL